MGSVLFMNHRRFGTWSLRHLDVSARTLRHLVTSVLIQVNSAPMPVIHL